MRGMKIVFPLALAMVLAACDGFADRRGSSDDRAAEGEVLGGTISDGMLPLESVESQSPPLKVAPTSPTADDAEVDEEAGGEGEAALAPAPPANAEATAE